LLEPHRHARQQTTGNGRRKERRGLTLACGDRERATRVRDFREVAGKRSLEAAARRRRASAAVAVGIYVDERSGAARYLLCRSADCAADGEHVAAENH